MYILKYLKNVFYLELEITDLSPHGCGPVFKYLFKKHEKLETISIEFDMERCAEDKKDIVLIVFSNINLRSITLYNIWYIGDILGCLPSSLPNLEKLVLTDWLSLSDQGLAEILNRSENIRELDLSYSKITGVGVEEGVNSLPNLEVLKLYCCQNLTDGGLKVILRLSMCTLTVLDVSCTRITGQGFKEGVSLPMLEELILDGCRQLTDSGFLEILSITGRRLKTVDVSLTNISSAVISTQLRTQYPFVKFTNW